MFVTGNEERCPPHVVQTISDEATKRNAERRSVLPYCHRKASFKHLVQENPNGQEHDKHNHEEHERVLTAQESVPREEFDQPQCKENRGQETEKFRYTEV